MTTPMIPTELDPKMERAAMALAYRFNQKDAGHIAGVDERTIRRWLTTNAEFVGLVELYRARSIYQLLAQLDGLQRDAVATLDRLLRDAAPNVQLGAARTLLAEGRKSREELLYQRRVAALEEAAITVELEDDTR